ncbi:MAG: ROK family protein [Candidatus Omnitrophota bacterium]
MSNKLIIAVDLGGTNLKVALLDSKFKIRDKQILSTRKLMNKEKLIAAIIYSINIILTNWKLEKKDILAVGLGLPGPIDTEKGIVHFFPNIPGWKEVKLKRILEKKLRLPVFLDNDANMMSLAEYKLGAAQNHKYSVCVTLGTGVGGGIIIDGLLYRGANNSSGEIGHIPINEKGLRCNCGGKACIETYIGNNRILKEAGNVFGRHISLEELSELAKEKNEKALKIWRKVGRRLGVALTGVVNLLNPDCIVIGGGVSNAGKILFDEVRRVVSMQAMPVQAKGVKIVKAKLGNDAGLIGAAILAKESLSRNKVTLRSYR